jgi:hypothetical protein
MTDSIIGYNFESNHATPTDDSNQIWLNWGPVVCRREDFLTVYIGGSKYEKSVHFMNFCLNMYMLIFANNMQIYLMFSKKILRLLRIMSIPTTFRLFGVLTSELLGRRFICIKDFNAETMTSLKLNLFYFFICGCRHHERKTFCLYVYISDITFRLFGVLTSELLGRRLPVFTLLLWQRQHIIVVNAVNYK